MGSFTLSFRTRIPWLALGVLLVGLLTWAVGAAYSVCFNPDIRFLVGMAKLQDRWTSKMDNEHGRKVVVIGGSSVMFSVIGERLLVNHGLPVVNMGLNAGIGAQVMTERALPAMRAGDTLLLAFEPGLLTASMEPPASGIKFSYAMGHPRWAEAPLVQGKSVPVASALLGLRPGAHHFFLLLGKIIGHKPLYPYRVDDASPSGWYHTSVRRTFAAPPDEGPIISAESRLFLRSLRDYCDREHIRVAYSLPWRWTAEGGVKRFRKQNAEFLLEVMEYVPVLKDPLIGADSRARDFSDMEWHLSESGAEMRTEELGCQLELWQTWKPEDLRLSLSDLSTQSPQEHH